MTDQSENERMPLDLARLESPSQPLEVMRSSIEEHKVKREQAMGNVAMADKEIEVREKDLRNLKRWRQHQADRVSIFTRRIEVDRAMLRSHEDAEDAEV